MRPILYTSSTSKLTTAISQLGELTDKGRQTTYDLGCRLRHLYVDQLNFMPRLIANADLIYLRATPLPRALPCGPPVNPGSDESL